MQKIGNTQGLGVERGTVLKLMTLMPFETTYQIDPDSPSLFWAPH
jgi:hypothetical protein